MMKGISIVSGLLLAILFSSFSVSAQQLDKKLILQLVNDARTKGCHCGNKKFAPTTPLVCNDKLENAATTHTKDMESKKFFSHTGSNGTTVPSRIEKVGYKWLNYGENIGFGYLDEKEAVEAWLKSPGHCKNIMNPMFAELGASRSGNYWTQVFARQ
jgi:uncharacterized protein YkwD